jgi:hypothetical protein
MTLTLNGCASSCAYSTPDQHTNRLEKRFEVLRFRLCVDSSILGGKDRFGSQCGP